MNNYKDYLKLYSNNLKENSIILKLLDIGKCSSLLDVRNIISNCKWIHKQKKINVYDFSKGNITEGCDLFYSNILIETDIKILQIIKNNNFIDIIFEGNLNKNLVIFGYGVYIKDNKKIGNIVNINKNILSISSDLQYFELNYTIDEKILIELNVCAVQSYNKGVCIYLPVIKINDNNWAYDCTVDKKTYENDNKLCFNLLDDINAANACGIISIGLLGAFIGKITYDKFQEKKYENNLEDKKILINILDKIKKINKDSLSNLDSDSNSDSDSVSESDSNSDSDSVSQSESLSEINKNQHKQDILDGNSKTNFKTKFEEKNYLTEIKTEILENNTINQISDIKKSIQDLSSSNELNQVLLNLQNIENHLDDNIEENILKFEKEYQKIKINKSINFENDFLMKNANYKRYENNLEDMFIIKEAEHYINLLNGNK